MDSYDRVKLALDSFSMYEIPLYLQAQGVDVSSPAADFSPFHYLITHTHREKLLLDLMNLYHASPLMRYQGRSLFLEACVQHKMRLAVDLLHRVPTPTHTHECPVDMEIAACFSANKAAKSYFARAWNRKIRNAKRLFFLMTVNHYRKLPLSSNLTNEIVPYI